MIIEEIIRRSLVVFLLWGRTQAMILRLPCMLYSDFNICKFGKRLEGHVLMEIPDTIDVQCTAQCTQHSQCRSYNINRSLKICQLNSKAIADDNIILADEAGWIYRSTDYNNTVLGPQCEQMNPCSPGILCRDKCEAPFYECVTCDKYHYGLQCDKRKDLIECSSNPCKNGALCTELVADYKCVCINGFTGKNCETDINECESFPCKNRGTCVNEVNKYSCTCPPGYSGSNCEDDINECLSNPCPTNSVCVNLINSYRCDCTNGYYGTQCVCAGNFTANTGSIVSPGHPQQYPNYANCLYKILAPAGKYIKVTFKAFRLEGPTFDWLEIQELISGTSATGKYGGTFASLPICASRSNNLIMKFFSDKNRRFKGFSLIYEFIDSYGSLGSCTALP